MQLINKSLQIISGLFLGLVVCLSNKTFAQTHCLPTPSAPSELTLHNGEGLFSIRLGAYEICIPKYDFGLSVYKNGRRLINNTDSSVVFKSRSLSIGKPSEYYYDENQGWIELRGWYSKRDNLWYNARYQFHAGKPVIQISFSITDRHDNHPSEASWDTDFWHKRVIQDLRFDFETGSKHTEYSIEQRNAYSGGINNNFPLILTEANSGPAYWSGQYFEDGYYQITHPRDKGKSGVRIYPRKKGPLSFVLRQRPLIYPYPSADGVSLNVVINDTIVFSDKIDQSDSLNKIGSEYNFDIGDYVELRTTGNEEGDRIVFGELNVRSAGTESTVISANMVSDDVLESQNFALSIKDFAKKYPIRAEAKENKISWVAINEPTYLYGGAGFSLDFALSLDQQAYPNARLQTLLDAPPEPSFPDWWLALDGEISTHQKYLSLLRQSYDLIHREDIIYGNYGWKNYGDYQISNSYHDENNQPVTSWAGLQYDLALGMMLSWISTGDQRLWNRARAAVRNAMDVQVVKFHPYNRKQSGAGLRKGTCPLAESHWCTPAIPEYNYHTRSLLLFSHLTGEIWPKEIARMQIDNSAYFALTRTEWSTDHDRIAGWALRNLYYGHTIFGDEGTRYITTPEYDFTPMPAGSSYQEILRLLVENIVTKIETTGGLGQQPVWTAQVIEGLIIAYENNMLDEDLRARSLRAIEAVVNKVAREQISRKNGTWWMVYYDGSGSEDANHEPELSNLNNYGWFWLNSLVWVSKNTSSDHIALTQNLTNWLFSEFSNNERTRTPRAWSGLMGFPSYAINELNRE